MRSPVPAGPCGALLLACSLLSSCGSPFFQPHGRVEEGPGGPKMVDQGMIVSYGAEGQLRHRALLTSEGKFGEAAEVYLTVYEDLTNAAEHREVALLRLGDVYSNVLNTARDYDKALLYLQKLLSEFPETELRPEAERRIEDLRQMQRRSPEK